MNSHDEAQVTPAPQGHYEPVPKTGLCDYRPTLLGAGSFCSAREA